MTPALSLAVALLVSTILAGCIAEDGDDPANGEAPSGEGSEGGPREDFLQASAHRFNDAEPVVFDIDESGIFALHEYCFPVSCFISEVTGEQVHRVELDIGEGVPAGVPARVELELQYDQEISGGMIMAVETENTQVFHTASQWEFGEQRLTMTFLRTSDSASVVVAITASFPGPPAETEWTLQGQLVADAARILPGIPVEIPMSRGNTGLMITTEQGEAEFLFWGGMDEFIGRMRTTGGSIHLQRPPNAPAGDPVILVTEGSASIQINATGDDPRTSEFNPLHVEWRPAGEAHTPEQGSVGQWTFDVEQMPLAIGLRVLGDGLYLNTYMDIEVSSPTGTVLEASEACGLCFAYIDDGEPFHQWSSTPGHPNHEAGTYTAEVDLDAGADFELQAYTIHYVR